jgi:hypothetical protein
MALLTTQVVGRAGVTPAYVAAAGGGDTFTPDLDSFIHIKNGGGSPITVTIVTPGTVRGLAIADIVVIVTNAQERMILVGPPDLVADPTTGLGNITYTGVTTVTIGQFKLEQG